MFGKTEEQYRTPWRTKPKTCKIDAQW